MKNNMRRARTALPLILLGLSVTACSRDATSPGTSCRDVTSLRPTVTVGQSIVIDWQPNCGVALLLVEENASDRWGVATPETTWDNPDEANRIRPRVTYGQLPNGSTQFNPAEPLIPGRTYEVVLWRVVPASVIGNCSQRLEQVCLVAVHEFTR